MQLLNLFARATDKSTATIPTELRQAEFDKVRALYVDDFVRQIWMRGDEPGACMIVEANSATEAAEAVSALPLVRAGYLKSPTIIPLKPYAGFAPSN